eukprot:11103496-Lingulodinium_polyedra.AAC.1
MGATTGNRRGRAPRTRDAKRERGARRPCATPRCQRTRENGARSSPMEEYGRAKHLQTLIALPGR